LLEFDNYAVVVARTSDVGRILFDDKALKTWTPVPLWGYSYAAFSITHGPHVISSSALFGAYVYGHSMAEHSSSAYGYAATFDGNRHYVYNILG